MVRISLALAQRLRGGLAWEQLLTTLGSLPERPSSGNRALVDLVALLADATLTSSGLINRIGPALIRSTGLKVVGIFDARDHQLRPLSGSVALKKLRLLAEDDRLRQFVAAKIGRFTLATLRAKPRSTSRLVVADLTDKNESRVLVAVADRPLAARDARVLHLAVNLLRLRQKNWRLQGNLDFLNRQFSALTDRVAEGLIGLGPDLSINLWNKNLQTITGYRAKETLGQPYQQFFVVPERENWLKELLTVSRLAGGRFQTQLAILAKDGLVRWVELSGAVLATGRRPPEQILISVRDVSHLRELEGRKNEFISIATHELRTPLTAVIGYLSLLDRQGANLTDPQRRFLSQAKLATGRLSRLTEELLWTVQIQEDRLMFKMAPIELESVARKVVADFRTSAENHLLPLTLKKPLFPTTVLADADRLEQVICNLVDNAVKYTPSGQITLDWRQTTNRQRRSFVTLLVQDTGLGIESKQLPEVFTKFRRLHQPETIRSFGAGLGLFIVKSFVEKMNGAVTVTSHLGKGTTFAVTFPCHPPNR